jgi:hypothetical protein
MVTPMQPRRVVDIWLEDGTHLTATEGHPFKTPEGWRDAILLKKGGKLLLPGEAQGVVEITQMAHRVETLTTYNLEVANAHTFFVGNDGVLVHNAKPSSNPCDPCNQGTDPLRDWHKGKGGKGFKFGRNLSKQYNSKKAACDLGPLFEETHGADDRSDGHAHDRDHSRPWKPTVHHRW